MMRAIVFLALLAVASAFTSSFIASRVNSKKQLKMTYWEGKAPPSSVLGVGEKIPSIVFGPASLIALIAGTASVHESNIFHQLSSTTLNPLFVIGSLLVPISWGLHVAAWIQKENGK